MMSARTRMYISSRRGMMMMMMMMMMQCFIVIIMMLGRVGSWQIPNMMSSSKQSTSR